MDWKRAEVLLKVWVDPNSGSGPMISQIIAHKIQKTAQSILNMDFEFLSEGAPKMDGVATLRLKGACAEPVFGFQLTPLSEEFPNLIIRVEVRTFVVGYQGYDSFDRYYLIDGAFKHSRGMVAFEEVDLDRLSDRASGRLRLVETSEKEKPATREDRR